VLVPILVNMKTASTLSFFHPKDKQHVPLTCLHISDKVLEITSLEKANFNPVFWIYGIRKKDFVLNVMDT